MKRRVFCIIICLCLLLSLRVSASSYMTETIETSPVAMAVETKALNYISKYVRNTFLYQNNDLYGGTIYEICRSEDVGQLQNVDYSIAGSLVSTSELSNRVESFKMASDYFRYIRTKQRIARHEFSYSPTVVSTVVSNDSAAVQIYTAISFKYDTNGETSFFGDNYIVYLGEIQNEWVILDVYSEELAAYGLTDMRVTYSDRIAEFDQLLAMSNNAPSDDTSILSQATSTTTYDRAYNANNAIAYAYTYTTTAHNDVSSGNNTAFLNENFGNYSDIGGNCQNFTSQCVWAGFGGNDDEAYVESNAFPMNNSWYESDGNAHSGAWTATDNFYDYVSSNSCEMLTVRGFVDGSFSYISAATLPGAVLHVNPKNGGYGHAVLITKATGQSLSEIEICGNSPMRKAVRLSDLYSGSMRLIIPTAMKNGRNCTGGTHSFAGSHCKCSSCGFVKLTVSGNMLKPVPAGSAQTIVATANTTCYRIAICVSYDDEVLWTEYTNTAQATRSFTFTQAGLYTITIVARDVDPSDADSVTSTHIYKVRVY